MGVKLDRAPHEVVAAGLVALLLISKVPPALLMIPLPAAVALTSMLLKLSVFSSVLVAAVVRVTVIVEAVITGEPTIVTSVPEMVTVPVFGLNSKPALRPMINVLDVCPLVKPLVVAIPVSLIENDPT